MEKDNVIKLVPVVAVVALAIYAVIIHFTWSVNAAEITLASGEVYRGNLSNSGFGHYKIETDTGVVIIDKNAVKSSSWTVPSYYDNHVANEKSSIIE